MNTPLLIKLVLSLVFALTLVSPRDTADVLSGRVYQGDKETEPPVSTAISGVTVKLFGSNNSNNLGIEIGTTTTDVTGWYGLTAEVGYEFYTIVETDPPGLISDGAKSEGGTVINDNRIRYSTVSAPLSDQILTGNKFWDKQESQSNNPPIADANGPYTGPVGQPITLDGSGSFDPDPGDMIVSYEWDTDNDGQYDDVTGIMPQYTWNSVGTFTISLRVTDTHGATSTTQGIVIITEAEPETGTIIIEKQTEPSSTKEMFSFSGDLAGSLSDGTQFSISNLGPGTYTSQEIVKTGWILADIILDDDNSSGDVNTATATFQLEAGETVKAVFINIAVAEDEYDFGDAPDPTYPTLLVNNGARHRINPDVYLGTRVDAEPDGIPNSTAEGDDNDGQDDEDGVVIKTSLKTGNSTTVEVTASTSGFLNAWIDYNQNGNWSEADEHMFINTSLNAGLNNLTLNVPRDAITGTTIVRFRFSLAQGLSFEGEADDGEVEDYLVEIDEGEQGAGVGDLVWHDLNQNGLQEQGEPGLDNVQVSLLDQSGSIIAVGSTNSSGVYGFGNLMSGTYQLRFDLKTGYVFSPADQGNDETKDSDAQPGTGETAQFVLSARDQILDFDAGMYLGIDYDFGDAPDPTYPTLLASNGARHQIKPNVFLGNIVDADSDGHPDNNSWGDDIDGTDDEDGIGWSWSFAPGEIATLNSVASQNGYLNAWIDFNNDGDWADGGEQIFTDAPLSAGINNSNFNVPSSAEIGLAFGRFRFSSQTGLSYDGIAEDGEIEDHVVVIDDLDYGDAPSPYPTLRADNGARHINDGGYHLGNTIDSETDGFPDVKALGDDNDGNDDEDGVVFTSLLPPGTTATLTVDNSMIISATTVLNAWIDFNIDGDWADAGEQIFTDHLLFFPSTHSLSFNIPVGASPGTTFARFRLSEETGISFDGLAHNGEVEDYQITINEVSDENYDFGDAPDPTYPTLIQSNGARHLIKPNYHLGLAVDGELNGNTSSISDGDDMDGQDDEDGVTMSPFIAPGQTVPVNIVASDSGVINAWLDFNINGSWADPGDQIIAAQPVVPGLNTFTINIPTNNITTGLSHTRFRFSSVRNLSYDGLAPDGEVEDYPVIIKEFGDEGSLVLVKEAVPKDNTKFDLCWNFSNPSFNGFVCINHYDPLSNSLKIFNPSDLTRVYEKMPSGWILDDIQITGDLDNGSTIDKLTESVDLDFDQGENIVITFKNKKIGDEEAYDFGDAPDPTYPTLSASNGARHIIKPGYYLGGSVDADPDGLPSVLADGDDTNPAGGQDDEDGVTMSPFIAPGQLVPISVFVPDSGFLKAWIDFNIDGDWADAGEEIISVRPFVGLNPFIINVPSTNITPGITYARFRFSSTPNMSYDGLAPDGEVEDYVVEIKAEGDDGSVVVIKEAHPPDNTPFMICEQFSTGFFNILCTPLRDPQNNKITILNPKNLIDVSEASLPQWTLDNITITGDLDNGSIINKTTRNVQVDFDPGEDIVIKFINRKVEEDELFDYGDAPDPTYPTLLVNNGARHKIKPGFYLGSTVDSETEGQPTSIADGDNKNTLFAGSSFPPGDEDGVLLPPIINAGQSIPISLIASDSGVVNAWLDFNLDGDWSDPGEHIIPTIPVVPGINAFTFNVPNNANKGQSFARFRLSSVRNISYDGPAPDGEVEDYAIAIQQGDGGNITIIKEAMPPDNTPFWITTLYGIHGGAAPYRDPLANIATITNGPVGIYHLGESVPFGWTLNDIMITGDTDNGSTINLGSGSAQIDLDAGENITVVFKNMKTTTTDLYDFGDAPSPYPTLLSDGGAYHLVDPNFNLGPLIDAENDGIPDPSAQGDDQDHLDDEGEMIYMPGFLFYPKSILKIQGQQTVMILVAVDREQDGSWNNNEFVYLIHNATPSPAVIDFQKINWPITLTPGIYNVRWRVYRDLNYKASTTGFGGVGEVEDCQFVVTGDETVTYDYGDAPLPYPTKESDSRVNDYGWRHPVVSGIHLGDTIDADDDGRPDPAALGDDIVGLDDEDGIDFSLPFLVNQPVELGITTSVKGYINGYIDLNHDGDWTDPGERMFNEKPVTKGLNQLTYSLPSYAVPGPTFMRFRFSTHKLYRSLSDQEVYLAIDGEVEDYEVFIEGAGPPFKWMQSPLLQENHELAYTPYFNGWGVPSVYAATLIADDWFCQSARPVIEVHWWGSYAEWDKPIPPEQAPDAFHIGIWTDVPTGVDTPWSHPGTMIWEWTVPRDMLDERLVGDLFHPEYMTTPDSCFQYDFLISEDQWFYQERDSTIYWLSIGAMYEEKPDSFIWSWNTRRHYFHDDAVYIYDQDAPVLGDAAINTLPIKSRWDMAFVLNTDEPVLAFDFGDAPDGPYPTFYGQNGAHHVYDSRVYLGDRIDVDTDGQPDGDATGDDLDGTDDDDGVFFKSPLQPGQNVDLDVKASVTGYLNAWADFNNNGQWLDPNEQIFIDQQLIPGINPLSFQMPDNALAAPSFMRFRFSTESNLPMDGVAIDGEVEDYFVDVNPVAVNKSDDKLIKFMLKQNYPNPFSSFTAIEYQIPENMMVRLAIYNLYGQEVVVLVNEQQSAGSYLIPWNGNNYQGKPLDSGMYILKIEADNFTASRKLLHMD